MSRVSVSLDRFAPFAARSANDRFLRERDMTHTAGVDVRPSLATPVKPRKAGCLAAAHAVFATIAVRRTFPPSQTTPLPSRGFLLTRLSDADPAPSPSAPARGRRLKPFSQADMPGLRKFAARSEPCRMLYYPPVVGPGLCNRSIRPVITCTLSTGHADDICTPSCKECEPLDRQK
jgi:hypothetical protein